MSDLLELTNMTGREILKLPMQENDADADTIGEYLMLLIEAIWIEEEGFSGKRPFGNSGWQNELYTTLAEHNLIHALRDEDGEVYNCDETLGHLIIHETIIELSKRIHDEP